MSSGKNRNIGHSIFQKLLNLAGKNNEDFNYLLLRYGVERMLYRLSISSFADKFILKGASLFLVWQGRNYRVTKDADLMSFGPPDILRLSKIFKDICSVPCEEDGFVFQPESVLAEAIREDQIYGGVRITLKGKLDHAVIPVQIDIGFGDSIVPAPERVHFPTLLDIPAPEINAYTKYTVVAEKFHAMVLLGMANSRMKDFFDIWMMNKAFDFDGKILCQAIQATFARRNTEIPKTLPTAFTAEFTDDKQKQIQWKAFIKKTMPEAAPDKLHAVTDSLIKFLNPVLLSLQNKTTLQKTWYAVSNTWK